MKKTKQITLENVEVLFSQILTDGQFGRSLSIKLREEDVERITQLEQDLIDEHKLSVKSKKRSNFPVVKDFTLKDGSSGKKVVAKIGKNQSPVMVDAMAMPIDAEPRSGSIVNVKATLSLYDVPAIGHGVSLYLNGLQVVKVKDRSSEPMFNPISTDDEPAF